jgi:hypothetical protein
VCVPSTGVFESPPSTHLPVRDTEEVRLGLRLYVRRRAWPECVVERHGGGGGTAQLGHLFERHPQPRRPSRGLILSLGLSRCARVGPGGRPASYLSLPQRPRQLAAVEAGAHGTTLRTRPPPP